MKHFYTYALALIAATILATGVLIVIARAPEAQADQEYMPQGASANLSRPCSFDSQAAQVVALSASSAATASATGKGAVRIVCNQAAHFYQGALGVTGPTAGTGSTMLPQLTPEYVYSTGGKFAFIRDSADGFCYVTDCK